MNPMSVCNETTLRYEKRDTDPKANLTFFLSFQTALDKLSNQEIAGNVFGNWPELDQTSKIELFSQAKSLISRGIRPVGSVFAVCIQGLSVPYL